VRETAEQLGPTIKMASENRMAVDMILAEKYGLCVLTGGECCTLIPTTQLQMGPYPRLSKA
jgi:hypothetical protein